MTTTTGYLLLTLLQSSPIPPLRLYKCTYPANGGRIVTGTFDLST